MKKEYQRTVGLFQTKTKWQW